MDSIWNRLERKMLPNIKEVCAVTLMGMLKKRCLMKRWSEKNYGWETNKREDADWFWGKWKKNTGEWCRG